MSWTYIDSSVVVATLFGEISQDFHTQIWKKTRRYLSSYLLQAEVGAAVVREGLNLEQVNQTLADISYVRTESILPQLTLVFEHGYIRGADAFHLATALWVRGDSEMSFYTLDKRQAEVAKKLGFKVGPT